MKQLGASPYGILQTPCRRVSRHPVPFPRVPGGFAGAAEFFDGTLWYCAVGFNYPLLGVINFFCDGQPDVSVSVAQAEAFTPPNTFLGWTRGELWNFYLKPRIEFWF